MKVSGCHGNQKPLWKLLQVASRPVYSTITTLAQNPFPHLVMHKPFNVSKEFNSETSGFPKLLSETLC